MSGVRQCSSGEDTQGTAFLWMSPLIPSDAVDDFGHAESAFHHIRAGRGACGSALL